MHLLAERFVFWGRWSGFSERRSPDLSNGTNVRDGSAKSFSHSHTHSHFCPSPSHRIAPLSHRIAFFAFFSHFRTSLIFLLYVSQLVHQKSSTKCEKYEKNAKKVWNANAMRKWNQNSHRIAPLQQNNFAFSHFFASHSHLTTIPDQCRLLTHQLFFCLHIYSLHNRIRVHVPFQHGKYFVFMERNSQSNLNRRAFWKKVLLLTSWKEFAKRFTTRAI
jgi:hypothetical protein